MRPLALLVVLLLGLSGCAEEANTGGKQNTGKQRVAGDRPTFGTAGPVTLDELNYSAPAIAGPWMAAFWLTSDAPRACQATFQRDMRVTGGLADTIMMVAKGWARPEVQGRIIHDYQRGDGFLFHAGVPGANQTFKRPTTPLAPTSRPATTSFKVDLPTVAFIAVGNSYMHNGPQPSLDLRLSCEAPFRLVHSVEGPTLTIFGPEDFNGFVVDTEGGFGAQRDAQRNVRAKEGLVALLHEDANQGNAQYTTTKPDGSQQVDTLGNRIAVGPPGAWRFGLNRISLTPGGEFRLFLFDIALPDLEEPKGPTAS